MAGYARAVQMRFSKSSARLGSRLTGQMAGIRRLWAEAKQRSQFAGYAREPFFRLAARHLVGAERILDIGAGSGEFIRGLDRRGVFAFEGNVASARDLRKWAEGVIVGRLPDTPFAAGTFDGIHISHVLEHLYHDEVYRALVEVTRMLRDGGVLIISGPLLWSGFYKDLSHVKPYSPEVFESYLCEAVLPSRTREQIGGFRRLALVYRYEIREIESLVIGRLHSVNFCLLALAKALWRLGIGYPGRTGFTIVLEKVAPCDIALTGEGTR
jgi:SAM-dependent methyltransferase